MAKYVFPTEFNRESSGEKAQGRELRRAEKREHKIELKRESSKERAQERKLRRESSRKSSGRRSHALVIILKDHFLLSIFNNLYI